MSAVLALAACGGGGDSSPSAQEETDAPTATEAEPTTTEQTPTEQAPPEEAPTIIRISVADGAPVGGIARPRIDKDALVVIVVRSDTAGEIHLHGYDIVREVAQGGTARLRFEATTPGRFELELEGGPALAQLTIQ
jgi:hypothetical protein